MRRLLDGKARAIVHFVSASRPAKAEEEEVEAHVETLSNATRDVFHHEREEPVTEGAEAEVVARALVCLASIVRRAAAEVARRATAEVARRVAAEVVRRVAAFLASRRTKTRNAELRHAAKEGAETLLAVRVIDVAGVAAVVRPAAIPDHASTKLVAAVAVVCLRRNQVYQRRSWVWAGKISAAAVAARRQRPSLSRACPRKLWVCEGLRRHRRRSRLQQRKRAAHL